MYSKLFYLIRKKTLLLTNLASLVIENKSILPIIEMAERKQYDNNKYIYFLKFKRSRANKFCNQLQKKLALLEKTPKPQRWKKLQTKKADKEKREKITAIGERKCWAPHSPPDLGQGLLPASSVCALCGVLPPQLIVLFHKLPNLVNLYPSRRIYWG